MKKCPYCAEDIQDVAVVCKHCGRDLAGSTPAPRVTVSGVDPFAEYHTPIRGKTQGRLTVIGYLGIVIGILFVVVSFAAANPTAPEQAMVTALIGVGFVVGSYLWARRPAKEPPAATEQKRCPFCAETVQRAATVCRYCNRDISPRAVYEAKKAAIQKQ